MSDKLIIPNLYKSHKIVNKSELNDYVCSERIKKLLKKLYLILIGILVSWCLSATNSDRKKDISLPFAYGNKETNERADSIMRLVIQKANLYKNSVSRYEAEIYTKGRTEILKQNVFIRLAHHLFPVDRKNKDMLFEMVSLSKYNAPQNFLHNIQAVNGNSIPNKKKQLEALSFLNLNVYSSTAYDDAIMMPIASNSFQLYSYNLESSEKIDGQIIHKIRFLPKQWSKKLVCGFLYIIDQRWTIDKIDMNGHYSFAEFNLAMNYGRKNKQFILPQKADLSLRYKVLGNVVATCYHSSYTYNEVEWIEEDNVPEKSKSLDLTNYYKLSSDTVPIIRDSIYWNQFRDKPLNEEEKLLYSKVNVINPLPNDSTEDLQKYLQLTEQLVNSVNMDVNSTRIKYSGFLNPTQFGYSARNGITYKQKIRVSKTFKRGKQIRFHPQIGYVFKRKQLFFKVGGEWEYLPERRGTLSFEIGNDNQSYSSKITKKINEELKDSTFKFDDLNLNYFKHYYAEIKNSIELFNGFELITGISYHRRIPPKKKSAIDPGDDVEEILNQNYHDFVPSIGFSYTPRQYYRMDGFRKEYVYSNFPTISLEIAKGIPGVGKSSGDYSRVEADVHQSIMLGLCQRLNYHISGGTFMHQKSTYFADFKYFARQNFPDTWDDQIGGNFILLNREWFNASDKYIQIHAMYENPFLLLKLLKINSTKRFMQVASRYILSERLYLSQLWTPVLPCYTEIGYGIGNHIFNIGMFIGLDRGKFDGFGCKFAFELFQ